ncbi:MAG TPA: hypothetical protein VMY76_13535 [Gemmatimonadales bacterium]|nr:hypothetical protein [Gemmatimonadales bacterium]
MINRLLALAGLVLLATSGIACARNTSRAPYGAAQDSTMTVKVDSTRTDTLGTSDTTSTTR